MSNVTASKVKDTAAKYVFIMCACMSVFAIFGIVGYILYASLPAFREIGIFHFLFGNSWHPEREDNPNFNVTEIYGIWPMFVSSVIVTIFSVILGGAIGIFTAIYLVFWCPDKFHLRYHGSNKILIWFVNTVNKINLREIFDQIIKLLAGIPSVIYGYFGMLVIVNAMANLNPNMTGGYGILSTILVLGIMIIPTITSLAKNALEAVPENYYEGSLALGNTKAQAVFNVVFPAARSGVISALILGIGRAVGETMAVNMVSGGSPIFPEGLFTPIRTLTTNIVLDMGETAYGSLHMAALMATGFVLLVLVLLINFSINLIPKSYSGRHGTKVLVGQKSQAIVYRKCGQIPEILKYLTMVFAALVVVILAALIVFILGNGLPHISWNFLFGGDDYEGISLLPAFISTGYMILITLVIALPLGIGAAIFFVEYARPGSKFVKVLRTFTDTLAGVPSIVFGLFGSLLFVPLLGGRSVLAGAFTLVLVVLPTIIRSTEESLIAVPVSLREASYGLGAGKLRTIFKIVLPSAFPGIATATVLSIGRIVSESAALIYTAGMVLVSTSSVSSAVNVMNPASTLTVFLYSFFSEGLAFDEAYATAVVLLVITLVLNLIVYFIEKRVKTK